MSKVGQLSDKINIWKIAWQMQVPAVQQHAAGTLAGGCRSQFLCANDLATGCPIPGSNGHSHAARLPLSAGLPPWQWLSLPASHSPAGKSALQRPPLPASKHPLLKGLGDDKQHCCLPLQESLGSHVLKAVDLYGFFAQVCFQALHFEPLLLATRSR